MVKTSSHSREAHGCLACKIMPIDITLEYKAVTSHRAGPGGCGCSSGSYVDSDPGECEQLRP